MRNLPKSFAFNFPGCFIAGGAVLSLATKTPISDYDLYPKTNRQMLDVFCQLLDDENCFVVNISDRAVTFKSNLIGLNGERTIIQVMTYDTFETAEKIFKNFDFTVCMGAFDCDTRTYIFHDDFYPDIATKTLRFNPGTLYPLNSLLRVNKYHSKGFFISKPELIRIALTIINAGMPTSWKDLEDQIGGAYGRQVSLTKMDTEYSLDAVMHLLSTISEFVQMDNENVPSIDDMSAYLEDMYQAELRYVVTNSDETHFIIDPDTRAPIRKVKFVNPKNCIVLYHEYDDSIRLIGYISIKTIGDGRYLSSEYSHLKLEYKMGSEMSRYNAPYIRVSNKISYKPQANYQKFKVSYSPQDLKAVNSSDNSASVTKLRLESVEE